MRRLFVVYNTTTSHAAEVKEAVLEPLRGLKGWMVGKFEVQAPTVEENAEALAKMLQDGDLVIAAGGDGTAVIAMNGVMRSGKEVTLGVLGYGNFNDVARMLGAKEVGEIIAKFEQGQTREIYPLEVLVNGRHWRYAPCYVTVGLLAEATQIFDEPKVRKSLETGKRGPIFSLWQAVKWYFRNKRKEFLPGGASWNGEQLERGTTDYLAVNGPTLAKIMKGGEWWQQSEDFGSSVQRLGGFWRMVRFGLKSVFSGVPLVETRKDELEFEQPTEVEIQAEGEYQRMVVKKIEVRKGKKVRVVE